MIDIVKVKTELDNANKLIEIAKKTKEDAIKAKTESETRVEMSKQELQKLGVEPEKATEEMGRLEKEIETLLSELKDNIPMDLLRELKRI